MLYVTTNGSEWSEESAPMEDMVSKMFTRSSLELKQDYKRQLDSADIRTLNVLHLLQGTLDSITQTSPAFNLLYRHG